MRIIFLPTCFGASVFSLLGDEWQEETIGDVGAPLLSLGGECLVCSKFLIFPTHSGAHLPRFKSYRHISQILCEIGVIILPFLT